MGDNVAKWGGRLGYALGLPLSMPVLWAALLGDNHDDFPWALPQKTALTGFLTAERRAFYPWGGALWIKRG